MKCICFDMPENGKFVVGKEYIFQYIIDSIIVFDDENNNIDFDDVKFLWYFVVI